MLSGRHNKHRENNSEQEGKYSDAIHTERVAYLLEDLHLEPTKVKM